MLKTKLGLFALVMLGVGCGTRTPFGEFDFAGDAGAPDSQAPDTIEPEDTTPVDTTPSNDVAEEDYARCDDDIPSSARSCGDDITPRGELCATRVADDVCNVLTDECTLGTGPYLDAAIAFCGVDFWSSPTHQFGMNVDLRGCVTSFWWIGISETDAQCVADWVMHRRFTCIGAETASSCPGPT